MTPRRTAALALAGLLIGAAPALLPPDIDAQGRSYRTVPTMQDTVSRRLTPQVEALLVKLVRERRDMTLDGVKVFDSGDKFLPGKIASAMAHRIVDLPADDPRLARRLADFADIADLTVDDPNDSWGIYYYVSALRQLQDRGLLARAVRPATLARLRTRLDWRRFVRSDLTLIDLPNNYYGVAFSIARMRFLLGWEDATTSEALLARTLDHYRRYSGAYGFADETEGKGRFDRYSVLLIGEIAQRVVETGMTPTPEIRTWLRRSVDLMLPRFNLTGQGWEYGRSIGAYGETAFLEVLTAAARLKVLTPTEERMAHAFSSRIAARYLDFWIDPATGSVDLWGRGRRTDAYRGRHRIFGENLSLARQYFYTNAIWNDLGYRKRPADPGYAKWLSTLPPTTTTWFARGAYDRGVVTMRDRGRMIALPFINGAQGQHMHNPYFPVPFSPGMLQGSADAGFPQLLPRFTLSDGSVLMPLAWFKDVRVRHRGDMMEVSWRQDALDLMGADDARTDSRLAIETRYRFTPGRIDRRDRVVPRPGVRIVRIDTEFASFSGGARTVGSGAVHFAKGDVGSWSTTGYGACSVINPTDPVYRSPVGAFASVTRCSHVLPSRSALSVHRLGWTLSYNSIDSR